MHTLLKTARPPSNRLTQAPTDALTRPNPNPPGAGNRPRVLDLGCGTGMWMLQMAQQFPNVDYHGFDINYMLPETLLENIDPYIPWDIESPWTLGDEHWDIIHAQLMLGSITNWRYLFQQIRRHITPGGWFESVEIDWKPRCNDGTMETRPNQPGLMNWWNRVSRAYAVGHRNLEYNENVDRDLEAHGFKDIRHEKYMIPLCGWHTTDPVLHRVGGWWSIAMSPGDDDEGCCGLEAMSLRPLMENERGWTRAHVQSLCAEALRESNDTKVHAYNVLHVVTARAPRIDGT
jgi:SAM-dependent methyltransferase